MKLAYSLLPGALALAGGAAAADLPVKAGAPAADYVKVCKNGGVAGFVIPGSDACLSVSGYVDAEVGAVGVRGWTVANGASRRIDDYGYAAGGQFNFDAVTNTAEGPLLAHVELRGAAGDKSFDWTSGGATVNAAYAQWAGFTVGRRRSFYWSSP
jgi:hypothetical protein